MTKIADQARKLSISSKFNFFGNKKKKQETLLKSNEYIFFDEKFQKL